MLGTGETSEAPAFDGEARAAEVEAAFVDALGGQPIASMCDAAVTHWACFYSGVTAPNQQQVRVELETDGGWSDDDLEQLADEAALHWFNFVGTTFEDLDIVVVRTNGVDSNHYRDDVPLLNR